MYAHTHIRIGTSQISSVTHTLVPICTPVCHFAVYMYRSILVQTKPVFHWPDGKAWQLHWKGPIRRGLAASPRTTCFAIACLQCNKQCGHLHHVVLSWCRSPAARHCTHYTTFKSSHFFFYETCILWEQAGREIRRDKAFCRPWSDMPSPRAACTHPGTPFPKHGIWEPN